MPLQKCKNLIIFCCMRFSVSCISLPKNSYFKFILKVNSKECWGTSRSKKQKPQLKRSQISTSPIFLCKKQYNIQNRWLVVTYPLVDFASGRFRIVKVEVFEFWTKYTLRKCAKVLLDFSIKRQVNLIRHFNSTPFTARRRVLTEGNTSLVWKRKGYY